MDARSLASEWTGDVPEDEDRVFAAVMDIAGAAHAAGRAEMAEEVRETIQMAHDMCDEDSHLQSVCRALLAQLPTTPEPDGER